MMSLSIMVNVLKKSSTSSSVAVAWTFTELPLSLSCANRRFRSSITGEIESNRAALNAGLFSALLLASCKTIYIKHKNMKLFYKKCNQA